MHIPKKMLLVDVAPRDGLEIVGRAMVRRNDQLRLGAVEMRAPIGHHTVAALRRVAVPAVAAEIAVMGMVAIISGILTRLAAVRPIQLLARSLPRCGVDMNMTRWTSVRCLNTSDSSMIWRSRP